MSDVLPDGPWDYKNNTWTIFGVAWAYDMDGMNQNPNATFTTFNSSLGDMNAADFGNYNAGYTGTYAGVPEMKQYWWAGMGEIAKQRSLVDMIIRYDEIQNNRPPYGDQMRDFLFNVQGMADARLGR